MPRFIDHPPALKPQPFINLPVKDLVRSVNFFTTLGYSIDPEFTDDSAACLVLSDSIFVMLLQEEKFREFTPGEISDANNRTEVLLSLTRESRQEVDETVGLALQAGGSTYREPKDHGEMYENGFRDPDGHIWEVVWMSPEAFKQKEMEKETSS